MILNNLTNKARNYTKYKLRKFAHLFLQLASRIYTIYRYKNLGHGQILVETNDGLKYLLNSKNYPDQRILYDGVFERESTNFVSRFCKEGMYCIDVGANFGYYSVLIASLVGEYGKVVCFEPSKIFRERLLENIELNSLKNIIVFETGLSNRKATEKMYIGSQTATMHWVEGEDNGATPSILSIELDSLDIIFPSLKIEKIDFIKADIDGHELYFLKGAEQTIRKFKPTILLEVNNLHYWKAGVNIFDFHKFVVDLGYSIYQEGTLKEITDLELFLPAACDYSKSANIILATSFPSLK